MFSEEIVKLNVATMFTDTFAITYKNINGAEVSSGIHTEFNSNRRLYILNANHARFFKPILQGLWIANLGLDIDKDKKQLEESKSNLTEMAGKPALKETIPEIEKQLSAFIKWINFLKSKNQLFNY